MKLKNAKASRKSPRKPSGVIEATLLEIARRGGFKVTKVSPVRMAKAKGRARQQDIRLIQSGRVTPAQIQTRNDMLPGKVEVLDWSPAFA